MDKSLVQQVDKKFQKYYAFLCSKRFHEIAASRNEVPFFISTFPPQAQNYVDKSILNLKKRLSGDGIEVLLVNLYDLSLEILEKKKTLRLLMQKEPDMNKDRFLKGMQAMLDVEKTIVPEIEQRLKKSQCRMVFLTGVGLVYPYIRTHNILSNIQRLFKDRPLVVFFPGKYQYSRSKGYTLNLFGLMPGDNYYRAFDLDEYAV
jgi:hypothetical protein